MARHLERSRGSFSLAFVALDDPLDREAFVDALIRRCPSLSIHRATLDPDAARDPVRALIQVARTEADAWCVFGLDQVFLRQHDIAMFGPLNRARDRLVREFRAPLVLIGAWDFFAALRARAPDFWSIRSLTLAPGLDEEAAAWGVPAPLALRPPTEAFVGRGPELAAMTRSVADGRREFLIHGVGGVGKTELARRLASEVGTRFPAAHVEVTAGRRPVEDVLASVVRALVPELHTQALPTDAGMLMGLCRSALVGKPAIILLDDVTSARQAEWLLGLVGPLVLITSRARLRLPDVVTVELGGLDSEAGAELLESRFPTLGPRDAREISESTGGQPLVLSLLQPGADGPAVAGADLRSVIAAVVDNLSPENRDLALSLAVFAGRFELDALAAVWGKRAPAVVDQLKSLGLIKFGRSVPRVAVHDLVRRYLTERPDVPQVAFQRHAEWYCAALEHAELQFAEDVREALDRYDEIALEVDAGQRWSTLGRSQPQLALASRFGQAAPLLLELRKAPRERLAWLEAGLAAAQAIGDSGAELVVANQLGLAYVQLGRLDEGDASLERARRLASTLDDSSAEASISANLALVRAHRGDFLEARRMAERALTAAVHDGDARGQILQLGNLGAFTQRLGDVPSAINYLDRALMLSRTLGDKHLEGRVMGSLASCHADLGHTAVAEETFLRSLAVLSGLGDRNSEALVESNLGRFYLAIGRRAAAARHLERSARSFEALGLDDGARQARDALTSLANDDVG